MSSSYHNPMRFHSRPEYRDPRRRRNRSVYKKVLDFIKENAPKDLTGWLIGANLAVFLMFQFPALKEKWFFKHFCVSKFGLLRRKRYWTLLTHAFNHQNFDHIVGNMVSLYSFGR